MNELREQLEDMALSLKSGSTKGRNVTGVFNLPVLAKYISQREEALLERLKAVIGQDEPEITGKLIHVGNYHKATHRNELRADLRSVIDQELRNVRGAR